MQQAEDLRRLDALIIDIGGADFGKRSHGPCGLLLEHLQAARRDLLGSMPGGYALSLDQAKESVACIPDKSVRANMIKTLQDLIGAAARTTAARDR